MSFFMNFNQVLSQKMQIFHQFLANISLRVPSLNISILNKENCPELNNLKIDNFHCYNVNEIQMAYTNFLKEK